MCEMRGLIFDVDGVIADTEAVNAVASIEMFDELFDLQGVQREDFDAGIGRGAEAYVRAAAAWALAEIGCDDKAAVSALTEALKDKDEDVRKAAAEALKKIQTDGTQ